MKILKVKLKDGKSHFITNVGFVEKDKLYYHTSLHEDVLEIEVNGKVYSVPANSFEFVTVTLPPQKKMWLLLEDLSNKVLDFEDYSEVMIKIAQLVTETNAVPETK